MIENRYHIISLAAVFLALGLGIFIGSTIVGVNIIDIMAEKQGILLGSLEQEYSILKKEIDDLRRETLSKQQEVDNINNILEQLRTQIISNRLQGKKLALIEVGAQKSSVKKIQDLLHLSNAQISFKTIFHENNFAKDNEEMINLISKENRIKNNEIIDCTGLITSDIDGFIVVTNENFTEKFIEMIHLLQEQKPVYIVKAGEKTDQELISIFSLENIKEEILFILELSK